MSYLKCISNALRDGEMTSDAADAHRIEFQKQYDKFKSQGYNDFEAERAAAKETWDVQQEKRIRSKETHYTKLEYKLRINLLQKIIKILKAKKILLRE